MGCDSTVDRLRLPLRLTLEPLSGASHTVSMPGLTLGSCDWRRRCGAMAEAGGPMRTGLCA